ncbi:MAG: hypothetical protein LBC17_01855 [Lactobacillaceae bacterium]|nr:hypothetical protein [Lactobacillaceae bacterium]
MKRNTSITLMVTLSLLVVPISASAATLISKGQSYVKNTEQFQVGYTGEVNVKKPQSFGQIRYSRNGVTKGEIKINSGYKSIWVWDNLIDWSKSGRTTVNYNLY